MRSLIFFSKKRMWFVSHTVRELDLIVCLRLHQWYMWTASFKKKNQSSTASKKCLNFKDRILILFLKSKVEKCKIKAYMTSHWQGRGYEGRKWKCSNLSQRPQSLLACSPSISTPPSSTSTWNMIRNNFYGT